MSTQEQREHALINAFGPTLANNPTALRECLNLLQIYRIEPQVLHSKWEAYIMSKTGAGDEDDDGTMTNAHLEGFKTSLRRTLEQQSQQQQNYHINQGQSSALSSFAVPKKATIRSKYHTGSTSKANYGMDYGHTDNIGSFDSKATFTMPTSPIRNRGTNSAPVTTSPLISLSSSKFALRKNIAEIEETLNGHLELRQDLPNRSADYRNAVDLVVAVKPYRYMFEKIAEKAEALDDRIEAIAEIYKSSFPETEFHNPAYPSQAIVTVVGRICSDANEGKSNERSLVLETSRSLGGGSRVRLDVNEITDFGFFLGQIVVLSGINANGSVFAVTRVHELPAMPMASASPLELMELHHRKLAGQPIKIIAAAGPYTLNDNLLFEPFSALMEHVNSERPDVLLLMGPFISSQHPVIQSGNVDMMPEAYFTKYISTQLTRYQERYPKEMQILLVPSLQDIIHDSVVLPQPSFEHPRQLSLPTGTRCLPNPAQFKINEMVFAVNTSDILMHLSGDEVARSIGQTDRMCRLSKYLIEQRNMHPVYPGLGSDIECGVDFNQYELMDLRVCPDVMILPSKLKSFAKITDNIIIVNPSQLSKGQSGGTYARLTIHPIPNAFLDDMLTLMDEDEPQTMSTYHRVYERCRVDLVRI
ncbi:DNA-directed DNA polymerase alpha subunit pol12 [Lobosporangium transversale]|uniref:DNA polymerase alpha subunit B n=1 Tax=Lobosporangium transversale TaxID=64571 RepID=A0A1Y2GHL5_9FUNG|nr:DNA polymerase alpha/epsilon subunit B-domain-containing protein [Lobosporangium transversale]KAF9918036.1 DNA-directed DNA polymerase alpha subunit pol12 [Lobosporangium transversale]ORZ09783.1 DNA polymerase alpha/epsilon subunit B-domain-containing protein [Lobosporangium transversale]|eukprot:XP_021879053.1 DNA polymerase alpha/epsilon subunit B-domain-containing protein [Lobosporangium transversale]